MLNQNASNSIMSHIAFPYASNSVATRAQVRILCSVALLLFALALCQRLEAGVPVPVVAVSLNDQGSNTNVYNEIRFDFHRTLIRHAQFIKDGAQLALQAAYFASLQLKLPSMECGLSGFKLLWPGFQCCACLLAAVSTVHRIVLAHILSGSVVNNAMSRFFSDFYAQFLGLHLNGPYGYTQSLRNELCALSGIVRHQIFFLFDRPSLCHCLPP